MKAAFLISLVVLAFRSCDLFSPMEPDNGMRVTFAIADTTDQSRTTFRTGESFDLIFAITNLTGKDQIYRHTGPTVILEIRQTDSTIASSVDGLAWVQEVACGVLRNGQTQTYSWRAPNSWARQQRIELQPGDYFARAAMRYGFQKAPVVEPPDIPFRIEL